MPNCNPYLWLAIVLVVLGIAVLVVRRFGPERLRQIRIGTWTGLGLVAGGVLVYVTAVAAYPACTAAAGACPAGFPAGSTGYTCTNEYTQCSWTGNCLTVAGTMPWESACECECTSTAAAVERIAEQPRSEPEAR